MSTLDYYNQNAEEYYSGTVEADVSKLYSRFEPLLPEHAKIIDIGCWEMQAGLGLQIIVR